MAAEAIRRDFPSLQASQRRSEKALSRRSVTTVLRL
jgi:hypothetical protein